MSALERAAELLEKIVEIVVPGVGGPDSNLTDSRVLHYAEAVARQLGIIPPRLGDMATVTFDIGSGLDYVD